jgi:hypothetical protein
MILPVAGLMKCRDEHAGHSDRIVAVLILWVWLIRDEVLDHLASVRAAIKHRRHREMVSGSTMRLAMSITAVTQSSPSKAFACISAARHAGSASRSKSDCTTGFWGRC